MKNKRKGLTDFIGVAAAILVFGVFGAVFFLPTILLIAIILKMVM